MAAAIPWDGPGRASRVAGKAEPAGTGARAEPGSMRWIRTTSELLRPMTPPNCSRRYPFPSSQYWTVWTWEPFRRWKMYSGGASAFPRLAR